MGPPSTGKKDLTPDASESDGAWMSPYKSMAMIGHCKIFPEEPNPPFNFHVFRNNIRPRPAAAAAAAAGGGGGGYVEALCGSWLRYWLDGWRSLAPFFFSFLIYFFWVLRDLMYNTYSQETWLHSVIAPWWLMIMVPIQTPLSLCLCLCLCLLVGGYYIFLHENVACR